MNKKIAENKKARFDYNITETLEAGIVLLGSEVKSLRMGKASIKESYASEEKGELFLINFNIPEYSLSARGQNHEPKRLRKLLVHKKEKNTFLHKYSLIDKGVEKELWENNVRITISKDKREFHFIEDIDISFKKNKIIQEVIIKDCIQYNLYKVHQEDIYHLYENTNEVGIIQLKEYNDYLILSVLCDNLDTFNQKNIF